MRAQILFVDHLVYFAHRERDRARASALARSLLPKSRYSTEGLGEQTQDGSISTSRARTTITTSLAYAYMPNVKLEIKFSQHRTMLREFCLPITQIIETKCLINHPTTLFHLA